MAAAPEGARRFDFADIVRAHRAELERRVRLTPAQRRVLTAIEQCRTAALGGHLDQCTRCGYEHPAYNSCRNRHCPKCQALAQHRWIEARRARMLDVPHFHLVFTLPAELRPLAAFARHAVFRALFDAVARTLVAFARSRLSATAGATLVLHTWNRKLQWHPHVHAIITGGGLSTDGTRWNRAHRAFLFPVGPLATVFRAKMMAALGRAYRKGRFAGFADFQDPQGFVHLARAACQKPWYVYAKPTFARGRYVLEYLGRYTHRVGLANSRLLAVRDTAVRLRTKGTATTVVDPVTLLGRFVQHVLPLGFHKIRHTGLYANPALLDQARARLGTRSSHRKPPKTKSWSDLLRRLTGRDVTRCPRCGGVVVGAPLPLARAPPARAA